MVLVSLTQVTVTLVFAFITRLVQLYKPRYPRFFQFACVRVRARMRANCTHQKHLNTFKSVLT